jgi:hypothetical protein
MKSELKGSHGAQVFHIELAGVLLSINKIIATWATLKIDPSRMHTIMVEPCITRCIRVVALPPPVFRGTV